MIYEGNGCNRAARLFSQDDREASRHSDAAGLVEVCRTGDLRPCGRSPS
jgi:hypothetical protein